ncbi:MAG: mandelate racemase/muconate lactonizing enzyme family protein [Bacillota bacterium]
MKITGIEIKHYRMELDPPFCPTWDAFPRRFAPTTLTFVHTDEGITGVGSGDTMYGFKESGAEELFLGEDPFEIEKLHLQLDTLQFHYGRYWPLELALWDIMGKATGQPVYKLLGGRHRKLLAYASTGEQLSPAQRAEVAVRLLNEGFKAIKIRFNTSNPAGGVETVRAVREAVGDKMDIMVDCNQAWRCVGDVRPAWDMATAMRIGSELQELGLYWLEEPRHANDYAGLRHLRDHLKVRIAGGEMNRGLHEFRELVEHQSLDVYQPDVALTGGILGLRKVANMVEAHGAVFTPHTWTNGIGLLANLHLAAAVGNCPYLEFPYDPPTWTPERRDFVQAEKVYVDNDGYLHVPQKPGLGIELDTEAMARYEIR